MKNGRVISIMLTWSTKQPRKSRISSIAITRASTGSPRSVTSPIKPLTTPEKLSTCAKVVAPTMMNRMVPDTATVPVSAFIRLATVRLR